MEVIVSGHWSLHFNFFFFFFINIMNVLLDSQINDNNNKKHSFLTYRLSSTTIVCVYIYQLDIN